MGFFSSLKQKMGTIVSKIGEVLNSPTIAKLGATLENRRSKVVETIGISKAMNSKRDSISESKKINDTLASYAKEVKQDSAELERTISSSLDQMHSVLESMAVNNTIRNRLNLDYSTLRTNAKDIFTTHISKRMSIADSECAQIMKMRPSDKKVQKMNAFSKQVTQEAARLASESIKNVLQNQNQQLKQEYESKIANELSLLKQNQKEIKRIRRERLDIVHIRSDISLKCTQIIDEAKSIQHILISNEQHQTITTDLDSQQLHLTPKKAVSNDSLDISSQDKNILIKD